jgi:uncharacterized protein (DUF1501 family)
MLNRREFMQVTGIGAGAMMPGVRHLFAQDKTVSGRNALVVLYLRGGQDAINVVVPYGDKKYYEIRPTIAIPAKDGDDGPGVIALDSTFGLHPSLKALKPLWEAKKLAPVVNAGSPHDTRSHFDAQDFMEYAAPGMRTVKNGWLNRYLKGNAPKKDNESELRAVAMQGLLPRALRGECPVLAVPEKHVLNNDKVMENFEGMYGGRPDDPVVEAGKDTIETLKKYKEITEKKSKDRRSAYPNGRFGQKLQDVASLIHAGAGLEVAAIDYGGWDHHANEGGNEGQLANMLTDVGGSLAAFANDLGSLLDSTLVLVMTEFGRTCRENGNTGTDHGHGGVMFLLGGAVKGGKVHGRWSGLEEKDLYQARDLPVTTDFRDVFAEVLRSHMKWDPSKDFFPGYKPVGVKGLF